MTADFRLQELCLKHAPKPDDGTDLLQLLEQAAKTIPQHANATNHTYMQILSKYCRRLGYNLCVSCALRCSCAVLLSL